MAKRHAPELAVQGSLFDFANPPSAGDTTGEDISHDGNQPDSSAIGDQFDAFGRRTIPELASEGGDASEAVSSQGDGEAGGGGPVDDRPSGKDSPLLGVADGGAKERDDARGGTGGSLSDNPAPGRGRARRELIAIRRGDIDPDGAYFSTPGSSTYYDEDAIGRDNVHRYDLSKLNIADTTDPQVTSAILRDALTQEDLREDERTRLTALLAEADSGEPFIDYLANDELPIPAAAERLGYDGILVWENDDHAAPSSVFAWNTYKVDQLPDPKNLNNYQLRDETAEQITAVGDKGKIQRNLDAIELLKKLQTEDRDATPAEQEQLAQYIDFGGLRQMWDRPWEYYRERERMEKLLSEEEIAAIKETSLNTHYTSIEVVDEMWRGVRALGFRGGRVLEPGMGVGNFFGRMPSDLSHNSDLFGVEKNILSGAMAQALYPDAKIVVKPYEQVQLPHNSIDLFIGNPPFADIKISDTEYKHPKLSLHNYFIVKSLDRLKPGSVAAVVTSRYTLDTQNSRAREAMFDRADLVAAIRLPDTAFKANAGTEVVTDILFFRKRLPGEEPRFDKAWLQSAGLEFTDAEDGKRYQARVNQYFHDHPEMVLGEHSLRGSMYGRQQYTLKLNGNLREQLAAAIDRLPQNITEQHSTERSQSRESNPALELAPENVKENAYFVEDGKVWIKRHGSRETLPPSQNTAQRVYQLKSLISLRDSLKDTIRVQLESESDEDLQRSQIVLRRRYEAYRENFGPLTGPKTARVFEDDPEYPLLTALENLDPETGEITRADIFTKRTARPYQPLRELPADPKAAMLKVLAHEGHLDIPLMAELLGQEESAVTHSLVHADLIYRDPVSGTYRTADEYLSGNVRQKLLEAQSAVALDPSFQRNIEALQAVQPETIPLVDIEFRLGQTWIPNRIYASFLHDRMANGGYGDKPTISRNLDGSWSVSLSRNYNRFALEHQWQGGGIPGHKLLEYALNQQQPTIYFPPDDEGKRQVDTTNTAAARAKLQEIKDDFATWVKSDALSKEHPELEKIYNECFNAIRLRVYDGSHLEFPGLNPAFTPRPYQAASVWRMIQEGRGLTDHFVGAGKTLELTIAGMELRRLGLSRKNMYVIPNNMIPQWREDFKKAYPASNVLAATDKDLRSAKNRQRLFARIATNEWDAVIIPQSQFDMLPISPERERITIERQMDELQEMLDEKKSEAAKAGEPEDKRSLRQMEVAKQKFEQRLKDLASGRKDNTIYFDDLGVDMLFVDEFHKYKALAFPTKMNNIAGLSTRRSQRAQNALAKIEYMFDTHNGRGFDGATGTSITNTIGEAFIMNRYCAPDLLEKAGIRNFDDWTANFAEAVTRMEYSTDGVTIRPKTALASFVNVPELQLLWSQFADVVTQDAAVEAGYIQIPKARRKDVLVKVTTDQEPLLQEIAERGEKLMLPMSDPDHPDPTVDNWLKLDSDARDISLDARFYNPEAKDDPENKANATVRIIKDVLERTAEQRGTVLVFSDRYQTSDGRFNIFKDIKDKLVAQGVSAEQIAIVHDYDKREDFYALQHAVRAGRVRVALGTTEKFGIGVNVQTRLKAEIHMDLPQRPDQVEQREGRIARNGNIFDEVEIYRLISEPRSINSPKAHDLQRAQLLERKQTFLTQFKSGNRVSRKLEDVAGDIRLSPQLFALAKAQATGNPLAIEKIKLEHEIRGIALLDRSHRLAHYETQQQLNRAEMSRVFLQSLLPKLQSTLANFQKNEARDEEGKLLHMKISFNNHDFTKFKEANEYLRSHPEINERTRLVVNDVPVPIELAQKTVRDDDLFRNITIVKYQFAGEWHEAPRGEGSGVTTAQSLLGSVLARGRELEYNIAVAEKRISENNQLIGDLKKELEKKSPYAEKLAQYEKRLDEVQAELMKNVKEAEELADAQQQAPEADNALENEGDEDQHKLNPSDQRLIAAAKQIRAEKPSVVLPERADIEKLMDTVFQEPRGKILVHTLSHKIEPGEIRREDNVKNLFRLAVSCDKDRKPYFAIAPLPGKQGEVADKLLEAAHREPAVQRRSCSKEPSQKTNDLGR